MSASTEAREALEQSDETLVFILDVRDPFSYLALGPAIELSSSISPSGRSPIASSTSAASVDWLPIRKHTLLPPSTPGPGPEDDRSIQHRRSRAQMIAREITIYADVQGLTIDSPYRDGHADAAYTAWLWIRATAPDQLPAFIKAVFNAYWAEGLDPESGDEILPMLERLGFHRAEFEPWASTQGRYGNALARIPAGEGRHISGAGLLGRRRGLLRPAASAHDPLDSRRAKWNRTDLARTTRRLRGKATIQPDPEATRRAAFERDSLPAARCPNEEMPRP